MKVYVYAEQCVQAGREVPEAKQDDNSADIVVYDGTPEELLDVAALLEQRHAHNLYEARVARTLRHAVYLDRPDLEPADQNASNVHKMLLEALREIAKGEGAFSRDPLTHAKNCIESMQAIAKAAIAKAEASE